MLLISGTGAAKAGARLLRKGLLQSVTAHAAMGGHSITCWVGWGSGGGRRGHAGLRGVMAEGVVVRGGKNVRTRCDETGVGVGRWGIWEQGSIAVTLACVCVGRRPDKKG